MVRQFRDTIHEFYPHIKGYQVEVWNFIAHFNAFNINSIPRLQNVVADFLATSASRLVPTNHKCSIELIFRPSIADNITNLRVFDDDKNIIDFMTNDKVFKESMIDDEEHQQI